MFTLNLWHRNRGKITKFFSLFRHKLREINFFQLIKKLSIKHLNICIFAAVETVSPLGANLHTSPCVIWISLMMCWLTFASGEKIAKWITFSPNNVKNLTCKLECLCVPLHRAVRRQISKFIRRALSLTGLWCNVSAALPQGLLWGI